MDTSPTYGDAEANIGAMAQKLDIREQLFMAIKVYERGRDAGIKQMQRSELLLGAPLDLLQMHNLMA